ncbi:MAG: hypothetical protein ACI841_000832 [Planctomycetota bacterium]|jgi:hypothetical protein
MLHGMSFHIIRSMSEQATPRDVCEGQLQLELGLERCREVLKSHVVYDLISGPTTIRRFMESHVFAVWDFQSLLTCLQSFLTCVEVPWVPTADPMSRRLLNEIVLSEESDEAPDGGYLSHYELYLQAMEEAQASTASIQEFVRAVASGISVAAALEKPTIPNEVKPFVAKTMSLAESGQAHVVASAFAYGREEVVPIMFAELVETLSTTAPEAWGTFRYYLERHIGLDSEVHGPQAKNLVRRLCGDDPRLWAEALEAARSALDSRIQLWDDLAEHLRSAEI